MLLQANQMDFYMQLFAIIMQCLIMHQINGTLNDKRLPVMVMASGNIKAPASTMSITTASHFNNLETRYPCAFIDTVNISGSYPQTFNVNNLNVHSTGNTNANNNTNPNNKNNNKMKNNANISYVHDWMVVPQDLVAIYDFIIDSHGARIPVERHLRACICKLKPCLRFCCSEGFFYDAINDTCHRLPNIDARNLTISAFQMQHVYIDQGDNISNTNDTNSNNNNNSKNSSVDIVNNNNNNNNSNNSNNLYRLPKIFNQSSMLVHGSNGSAYFVPTKSHFIVHIGAPCENMRTLYKGRHEIVDWRFYENGTISYKNHLFPKTYCYTPYKLKNEKWMWQPLACVTERLPFILSVREWTYAICLIIAVICMAIILCVHLFCNEIRNTFYGVAIKAYTLCLIIGYSLMAHLVLTDPSMMSQMACLYIPCFILLYIVLSFYVLSFISFHFYLNYHGVILTKLMFWLIFSPIVIVAVIWSLFVGHTEHNGKPIFGGETCWFDPRNWSIMIYFYGPIFVACSISIFFYILTLIRITERKEPKVKRLKAQIEENRYTSFCKFLTYTLLTWLVCVTSFAINYYRAERSHINYAVCLVIALHGFGSLYALIGKNQQIQNFLRRIEEDIDDDDDDNVNDSTLPMRSLMGD